MSGRAARIVVLADLMGTGVFAAEGALIAMAAHLDLLGIAVIAFVTAVGGGMLRDLLLGASPPAALRGGRYLLVVLATAGLAILLRPGLQQMLAGPLLVLDAAGLALFAVAGTEKALEHAATAPTAILLGAITATGGGLLRDLLLAQVPAILRVGFTASPALVGAAMLVAARRAGVPARAAALLGCAACFALRILAAWLHWRLPVPH